MKYLPIIFLIIACFYAVGFMMKDSAPLKIEWIDGAIFMLLPIAAAAAYVAGLAMRGLP